MVEMKTGATSVHSHALGMALVLVALAVFLAPAVLLGDARELYRAALESLEGQRFEEAAEHLRAALAERPVEEKGGLFRRRYLPHYYLGVALAASGDCTAALDAWEESSRQGAVGSTPEGETLDHRRTRCREQLERIAQVAAEAEDVDAELVQVQEAAIRVARLREDAELERVWKNGAPSFYDRQVEGLRQLSEARRGLQLAVEEADPQGVASARQRGELVRVHFQSLAADAEELLARRREILDAAVAELTTSAEQARSTLAGVEDLRPFPRRLGLLAEEVERGLRQIARRDPDGPLESIEALLREIDGATVRLVAGARRPPAELLAIAEAFVAGHHGRVIERADTFLSSGSAAARNSRLAGPARLMRAAALHAQWMAGGRQAVELRAEVEDELFACASLKPRPVAPARFYSPAFRRLWRATVAAVVAAPVADGPVTR